MLNKKYLKNKQLQANVFIIYINYFYYYYYYNFFKLLLFIYLFFRTSPQATSGPWCQWAPCWWPLTCAVLIKVFVRVNEAVTLEFYSTGRALSQTWAAAAGGRGRRVRGVGVTGRVGGGGGGVRGGWRRRGGRIGGLHVLLLGHDHLGGVLQMLPQLVPGAQRRRGDFHFTLIQSEYNRAAFKISWMSLRQSSQTNGGEEVDGEAGVSGVVPREEAFEERLQGPKKPQHIKHQSKSLGVSFCSSVTTTAVLG